MTEILIIIRRKAYVASFGSSQGLSHTVIMKAWGGSLGSIDFAVSIRSTITKGLAGSLNP